MRPPESATPVAIVGIGLRFPQADSPDAFFQLLDAGVDAVGEVPASRWDAAALAGPDADAPGKTRARWGGFLGDVHGFDAGFFGISPREAARMDPQQRLLLEVAWEALEDAGMPAKGLAGTPVGVFVGASTDDHTRLALSEPTAIDVHTNTGAALSILANRLSYMLDLRGPSMVIDTACSSSLLAVHLACRSLAMGESHLALAGGVNLMLNPALTIGFSRLNALSPTGRCKTFDASADGYVRAEGAAFVVLKPLERAVEDGDRVYAVIRGSAVNQDGRSNGLTAPSRKAQETVLRAAYAAAGDSPGRVQYVEAHGTGTLLGDPIEIKALGAVVAEGRGADAPCWVGSVKTNIGHAESAAGVAGLIKAALCLKRRRLVPSLHLAEPNPYIPFATLPVRVATESAPWPAAPGEGLAGVSAFGFGGTNVHVVLAEAPVVPPTAPEAESSQLLAISARDEGALKALATEWRDRLATAPEASLAAVCRAAARERDHHDHRLAVVGANAEALTNGLAAFLAGTPRRLGAWGVRPHRRTAKRALVFCGQGALWRGVGRDLWRDEPLFRQAIEAIDAHFVPLAGWSIAEALTGATEPDWDATEVAQPLLFALQVGLAAVLDAWGVSPELVVGHSAGEIAAAHVAGALDLADAVSVAYHRGRVMQRATGWGGTAAIGVSADEAAVLIAPHGDALCVSGLNGPCSVTIAGPREALDSVVAACEAQGIFARRLPVAYAFHHPWLAALQGELESALDGMSPRAPRVPLFSTLTGDRADEDAYGPAYWARQLVAPVAFQGAIEAMAQAKAGVFIEVGPHPVLASAIQETLSDAPLVLATLRRAASAREELLGTVAALYARGEDPAWATLMPGPRGAVDLPTYPWQRETYQLPAIAPSAQAGTDWLGQRFDPAPSPTTTYWQRTVSVAAWPSLGDHRVGESVVVPGAAYMDWAVLAGRAVFGTEAFDVTDLAFSRALIVPDDGACELQLALTREAGFGATFEVFARREGVTDWTRHASARLVTRLADGPALEIDSLGAPLTAAEHYALMRRRGLAYGPAYQGVTRAACGAGTGEAEVVMPDCLAAEAGRHAFPPALLDACMQIVGPAVGAAADGTYMPVGVGRFRLLATPGERLECRTAVRAGAEPGTFEATVTMDRPDGTRVAEVTGLVVQRVDAPMADPDRLTYETRWEPIAVADATPVAGRWVVADGGAMGVELAGRLARGGAEVVRAAKDELARAIAEPGVRGVIALGALEASDPLEAAGATLGAIRASAGAAPAVWVVTAGAMRVHEADTVPAPGGAAAWGLAGVAWTEYPETAVSMIDLPECPQSADWEALIRAIFGAGSETQLAVRGGEAYGRRLAPLALTRGPEFVPSAVGTHLITGGLGGIGLGLADWLIGRGARHLALVGRSAPRAEAEVRLAAWRAAGVDVRVFQGDVSQGHQAQQLIPNIEGAMSALAGVYHAAGILRVGPLSALTDDDLAESMAAKADGAWHLHTLTHERTLEAFVLFGSAAATLGSHGQGAYAAANAALVGLAEHRRAAGLPATAIEWGPWAGVGMAGSAEDLDQLRALGLAGIPATEAFALLGRVMGAGVGSLAAIDFVHSAYRAAWPRAASAPYMAGIFADGGLEETGNRAIAESMRALAPTQRLTAVEVYLARELGDVLGRSGDSLDRTRPLNALGLDSMMGLQLRNRVTKDLGVELAMMELLRGPTLEELAALIAPRLGAAELTRVVPQALTLEVVLQEPERLLASLETMSEAELDRWLTELESV